MMLVVIGPESNDSCEATVLGKLFAAGRERHHVREPAWPRRELEVWLRLSHLARKT